MTYVKDLEVGQIYRHIRGSSTRWIILEKTPCLGGFEISCTTIDPNGVWEGEPIVERHSPGDRWPVELDMYLISEEEDVPALGSS